MVDRRDTRQIEGPVQEKRLSLQLEFVELNHKTLTIIGVFFALTVFSSTVSIPLLADVLSGSFLTCAWLLILDIRFPQIDPTNLGFDTVKLFVFTMCLSFAISALTFYIFIRFPIICSYMFTMGASFLAGFALTRLLTTKPVMLFLLRRWDSPKSMPILLAIVVAFVIGGLFLGGFLLVVDRSPIWANYLEQQIKKSVEMYRQSTLESATPIIVATPTNSNIILTPTLSITNTSVISTANSPS